MASWWQSQWSHADAKIACTATAVAIVALLSSSPRWLSPNYPKIIPSPLQTTIPSLSENTIQQLDYKPDALPGARDVQTPYGSIRVYEWGPEDGQKVLLIHGISTSCMTLVNVAFALVSKNCRVILFDLFCRGFTDGVGDLPHDVRLYTTQILLVLASSSLSWTGQNAFNLVGYSFGGAISIAFANAFPALVKSLVLLAPVGLVRTIDLTLMSRLALSGWIPERLLAAIVRRRLHNPISKAAVKPRSPVQVAASGAVTEVVHPPSPPKSPAVPEIDVLNSVRWMLKHHAGFVPAFMSCARYGPVVEQQDLWRQLSRRDAGQTVIIFGHEDMIVCADNYTTDGLPLVGGRERVVWATVGGGHDFLTTHTNEALAVIFQAWVI